MLKFLAVLIKNMEEIGHIFCYQLNFLSPHQGAKFKNFHYDKLNPEYEILSQKEFSNYEHCKTLYTRCDYLLEESVHGDILKLEQLFKEYQKLFEQELKLQFDLINVIWIQSQRYLTITRSAICVKKYPEILSLQTENRALCKFHSSLKKIRESNYLLTVSMKKIQKRHSDLNHHCLQLDMSVESSFINGNEFLNSLSYITKILNDLFDYFNSNLCKMMCWAQLIDPGDSVSIEDYMNLIKSNRESDVKENLRYLQNLLQPINIVNKMTTDIQVNSKKQNEEIEEQTLKQLLDLEKGFREHNTLTKTEMQLQKELVARMWILSQRYILLESTGPCCRYPEIYSGPAEDTLLQEFSEKLKLIRTSNCRISGSLSELRKTCIAFDNLCAQLDMTTESPLIVGDAFHKPITYFIELVSDLFKYFHAWLLKLKYSSHQFDPAKIDSIENYKKEIEISEDFEEYLNMGLAYCMCLRLKAKS